jgi:hypothetical protein
MRNRTSSVAREYYQIQKRCLTSTKHTRSRYPAISSEDPAHDPSEAARLSGHRSSGMESAIAMASLLPSWHAMNCPDGAAVVVQLGFDRDPGFLVVPPHLLEQRWLSCRWAAECEFWCGAFLIAIPAFSMHARSGWRSTTIARQLVVHRSPDR